MCCNPCNWVGRTWMPMMVGDVKEPILDKFGMLAQQGITMNNTLTLIYLQQCFSTFFSWRNPFVRQKYLQNPKAKEKMLREHPRIIKMSIFVGMSNILSLLLQNICSSLVDITSIFLIKPTNLCKYKIKYFEFCGTLSNVKKFTEPLADGHGALGFRRTPVEKH